jgi:Tol biopolymer transport system component
LYLASADGSTSLVLPGQPAGTNSQAAWSANGNWIVFQNNNVVSDLFMIQPNGSNLTRLTDDAAVDAYPAWLPDGSQLVFVSDRDGTPDLYALLLGDLVAQPPLPVPVPSIPVERLTNTPAQEASPHYSPNGAQIVFARLDADWNIYIGSATNLSSPSLLSVPGVLENMPSWSSDGAVIVFVRDGQIFRMSTNAAGQTEIVNGLAAESNPVWEP